MALRDLDKKKLIAAFDASLRRRIERMTALTKTTIEGATHEESRPEDDKDTRGLEASYLARGQALRVAELERDLTALRIMKLSAFGSEDPISLSALVELEDEDGALRTIFLAPRGGGLDIELEGVKIDIVTPGSPLGQELMGRRQGESVDLLLKQKNRELVIVDVA
jgi:transcription elongation GreA/GreB family factor